MSFDRQAVGLYHTRQRRRLRAGEPAVGNFFTGNYNAVTNLVVGGVFDGLVLPAANTVGLGTFFSVTVAGTLSTLATAPEINGQPVVVGDELVVASSGYIIRSNP